MVGYSGTPLERKLGVKPEHVVLLDRAPDEFDLEAPTTRRLPKRLDISLTFHTRRTTLEKRLPQLIERTEQAGMIWVCWPKKAAKVPTDLDDNIVREIGSRHGLGRRQGVCDRRDLVRLMQFRTAPSPTAPDPPDLSGPVARRCRAAAISPRRTARIRVPSSSDTNRQAAAPTAASVTIPQSLSCARSTASQTSGAPSDEEDQGAEGEHDDASAVTHRPSAHECIVAGTVGARRHTGLHGGPVRISSARIGSDLRRCRGRPDTGKQVCRSCCAPHTPGVRFHYI